MTELQLFGALPESIEAALRASIERFGVLVPVAVDQDGLILDGHNRVRIAGELAVSYETVVHRCADDAERREIARSLNADRRQLTEEQRRVVAEELRLQGHSTRAIAGALGVAPSTIHEDLEPCSGVQDRTPEQSAPEPESVPEEPRPIKGLDGKSYSRTRPSKEERERRQALVADYYKQGYKRKAICRALDIGDGTITQDLRVEGIDCSVKRPHVRDDDPPTVDWRNGPVAPRDTAAKQADPPTTRSAAAARKQAKQINSGIHTLNGLRHGFETVESLDPSIDREEAARWERDLFETLRVLRSFHIKLKEHVNGSEH